MAAAYYHAARLTEVETNVNRILENCRAKDRLGRATMGIVGTRKMDIEYQAFVLAFRRCLDYLSGAAHVRNRVAHYEFVSAGCVNLTAQGFFLAGGGEELRLPEKLRGARLGQVLSERIMQLHGCVDDMVDTFVEAAREDQS
jgi:hypothetical protein